MNPSLIEELARALKADRARRVARRRPARHTPSIQRRPRPTRSVGSLFIRVGVRLGGLDSVTSVPASLRAPMVG